MKFVKKTKHKKYLDPKTVIVHTIKKGVHIPITWILVDNQSTVNVFNNKNFLKNIRKYHRSIKTHCNAGTATIDMVGDLPGFGMVWYHPEGIANILSISSVKARFLVTYNSNKDNELIAS